MNRSTSTANASADLGRGEVVWGGFFYSTTWKIDRNGDLWKHFKLVFPFQMVYTAIQYSSSLCYLSFYL